MKPASARRVGACPAVVAALLAAVLVAAVAVPASAASTQAAGHTAQYPTWDEVQAARGNEAATAAAISTIDGLLTSLQTEAARLGDAAVMRAAEADAASKQLDRSTAAAASLASRATAAAAKTRESAASASQIAAVLYRSGGANLTGALILTGDEQDSGLLYRLGVLGKLGGRLQEAMEKAESDRNQAEALSAQARTARVERERVSTLAAEALVAASSAEAAADATLAAQQANQDLLYGQLASLKNTTVQAEQQYRAGQQAQNQPAPSRPAPSQPGTTQPAPSQPEPVVDPPTSPAPDPGGIVVPGGEVNDVSAARSYAFGQLAGMGFGADQNNCLLLLWNRESGWRTNAYNGSSGAYGIPQSLPGSKMSVMGADWRTNYVTQVNWGLSYITSRYDTPCGAWAHSESIGWY